MKKLPILILCLSSIIFAQNNPIGMLSFVEDRVLINPQDIADATREDPRRVLPFIEVIHLDNFNQCLNSNFDQNCPQFEWSVNFLERDNMTDFEEALVKAWLRFELRSYYRARLEAGQDVALIACNVGQIDMTWYTLTGEFLFPGSEFCDDYRGAYVLANCFFECSLPFTLCPSPSSDCINCATRNFTRSLLQDQMARYYPDYLSEVSQAITNHLPTALLWNNPFNGAVIVPVADISILLPSRMLESFREAANKEIIAPQYYFQTGADNLVCQPFMPNDLISVLVGVPGYGYNENSPGISTLEEVKKTLSSRESAGDTRKRFNEWIFGKSHLLPKYDENGAGFFGIGGKHAYDSLANPLTYSCFGFASIYQITSKWETIIDSSKITTVMDACYVPPFQASATVAFASPMSFTGQRAHTALLTIPEGYEIPNVQGTPLY